MIAHHNHYKRLLISRHLSIVLYPFYFSLSYTTAMAESKSPVNTVKTWMVLDTIPNKLLDRFRLCNDEGGEELARYDIEPYRGSGFDPERDEQRFAAFTNWAKTIACYNVPNAVKIWQFNLDPEVARVKKPFYESFYGVRLVEWIRTRSDNTTAPGEIEDSSEPELNGSDEKSWAEYEKRKEANLKERKAAQAKLTAWTRQRVKGQHRGDWSGVEAEETSRFFVQMPDYCFTGDDLEPEKYQPQDAFSECSKGCFDMSMQPMGDTYLEFSCTCVPHHDSQRWRAYFYEPRPMRSYSREHDSKKRKRHPSTEEETEHERQAKRRTAAFSHAMGPPIQRIQPSISQPGQSPLSSLRQSPPCADSSHTQTTEIISISSSSSSSDGFSSEEEQEESAQEAHVQEEIVPKGAAPEELVQEKPSQEEPTQEKPNQEAPAPESPVENIASVQQAQEQLTRAEAAQEPTQEARVQQGPAKEPEEGKANEETGEQPDQEENVEEDSEAETADSSSTDSSTLSSSLDSEELNELGQGTEVWKGQQKRIGLKHKKMEDL